MPHGPSDPLAARLAAQVVRARDSRSQAFVVGLCGPQGSGKSTLAESLQDRLCQTGASTVVLSLDDLYLTRREREILAETVHPLLAVRGPPGTHDVQLGLDTLDRLSQPGPVAVPRFDKALDDRSPPTDWTAATGPVDFVLFEGWCVGASPQAPAELREPMNALERDRDPQGLRRGYVNDALAGPYQTLFARIDFLVLLQAPGFDVVVRWRQEQERALRARLLEGQGMGAAMSDDEVAVFVQYYERLSRHIASTMPPRADVVITLDGLRQVTAFSAVDPEIRVDTSR